MTTALHLASSTPWTERSAACETRQPLNALDTALYCVDRTIRSMGYPGFDTQMLVWLAGRIDGALLRRGVARLGRRHPVLTSRLIAGDSNADRPCWEFRPDAEIELQEKHLQSAEPSEVLAWAARLQSTPYDPLVAAPLRLHWLHRPGGGDVIVMHYNHVLLDNGAAGLLLRELEQLSMSGARSSDESSYETTGLLPRHARRFSHVDRRRAARRAIDLQGHALRGRAALLGKGDEDKPRQINLQIAGRSLAPEMARAIHDRTAALCGFPNLSMAILAATFRAIRQLGTDRNAGRNYIAGIGLDLNLRRRGPLLLQNLSSIVPIIARPEQLDNTQQLVPMLSRQMRERVASKYDLGVLRLATGFHRRHRHIRWVVEHLLRWGYSLWYAYFGPTDYIGHRLWDTEVERICYVGPTWSPIGISLLANQSCGQLHLQATYDPDLVPSQLASAFLDAIVDDLADFVKT